MTYFPTIAEKKKKKKHTLKEIGIYKGLTKQNSLCIENMRDISKHRLKHTYLIALSPSIVLLK